MFSLLKRDIKKRKSLFPPSKLWTLLSKEVTTGAVATILGSGGAKAKNKSQYNENVRARGQK